MPVARPEVLVVETDHPVRVAAVAAANQLRHAALREGTEPEGIYIMIQGRGWPSPTRVEVHIGSDLDAPASCRYYDVSSKRSSLGHWGRRDVVADKPATARE